MRVSMVMMIALLLGAPVLAGDNDSVKGGMDEAGRAIEHDVKEGYDKTKDATVDGYDKAKNATEHGVGTAMQKTGEGMDTAGDSVEGAGKKVDDSSK